METLDIPKPVTTARIQLQKPVSFAKALWDTLYNWRELWFWPAVALLQWYVLLLLAYGFSGRRPEESYDFLAGLGANILIVVFAISLVSILKEATSVWWTKEDLLKSPIIACESALFRLGAFLAILWALKH
jgi:hypothetical protein